MMFITIVLLICFTSGSVAGEPKDSDRDGMPDAWEKQYGLNHTNATDAAVDTDGDGFSNFEEYKGRFQTSTDPTEKRKETSEPSPGDSLKAAPQD